MIGKMLTYKILNIIRTASLFSTILINTEVNNTSNNISSIIQASNYIFVKPPSDSILYLKMFHRASSQLLYYIKLFA